MIYLRKSFQGSPSGIVTEDEFKEIYCQIFPNGDPAQYAYFVFSTFDSDGNGQISFDVSATSLQRRDEQLFSAGIRPWFVGVISRHDGGEDEMGISIV